MRARRIYSSRLVHLQERWSRRCAVREPNLECRLLARKGLGRTRRAPLARVRSRPEGRGRRYPMLPCMIIGTTVHDNRENAHLARSAGAAAAGIAPARRCVSGHTGIRAYGCGACKPLNILRSPAALHRLRVQLGGSVRWALMVKPLYRVQSECLTAYRQDDRAAGGVARDACP